LAFQAEDLDSRLVAEVEGVHTRNFHVFGAVDYCNRKAPVVEEAPVVEAAPHIHPHMLVPVGHNLVVEDIRGQVNKTAGGSCCSDGVQRH
jgi:hypothetical protein